MIPFCINPPHDAFQFATGVMFTIEHVSLFWNATKRKPPAD